MGKNEEEVANRLEKVLKPGKFKVGHINTISMTYVLYYDIDTHEPHFHSANKKKNISMGRFTLDKYLENLDNGIYGEVKCKALAHIWRPDAKEGAEIGDEIAEEDVSEAKCDAVKDAETDN